MSTTTIINPGASAAGVTDTDAMETLWCVASLPAVRLDVRNDVTGVVTTSWIRPATGATFVPTAAELTGATPGACGGAAAADIDVVATAWCVGGSAAVRYDARDNAGTITTTWVRVSSGAAFVPTAAELTGASAGPCPVIDQDFAATQWCIAGSPAMRYDVRNESTGAISASWLRPATGIAFNPTAAELASAVMGPCPGSDIIATQWCVGGLPALRYDLRAQATGVITSTWTRSNGTAFVPTAAELAAATIGQCATSTAVTVKAYTTNLAASSTWTPTLIPAGRLVGFTYTVVQGTASITNPAPGGTTTLVPTGYTASWDVTEAVNTVTPPASIVTDALSRVIITMSVV